MARMRGRVTAWIGSWGSAQNQELQELVIALQRRLDELVPVWTMQHQDVQHQIADVASRVQQLHAPVERAIATSEAASRLAGVAAGVPDAPPPPTDGPLVSVVVPAHGAAPLLARALRSIAAQTYARFECIVVSDGGDPGVADGFSAVSADSRFRLVTIERRGVCGARNAGLADGSGALYAFLDADNQWTPWHLAASVAAFVDSDVHATYAAMLIERAGGVVDARSQPFDRAALLDECFIDLNVLVHRRALYEQQGGFDEAIQRLVDWDYVARLTEHVPAVHLRHIGCIYDDRENERISTTRPIGPSWYTIRSKWRGRPAEGVRALWVTPAEHDGTPAVGADEVAGLRALGATVALWSPSRTGGAALADAVREHSADVVHFSTAALASRYLDDAVSTGAASVVRVHRPAGHVGLLDRLALEPTVQYVLVPPGTTAPGLAGRRVELGGLFSPDAVGTWDGVAKDHRLVAVAAHGHVRAGLADVLRIAALSPAFRFVVTVPDSGRSRRLASFVEAAASADNVEIVRTVGPADARQVIRGAAFSLHPEHPWWLDGPIAAVGSLAAAAAAGCIPVITSARDGGDFDFASLRYTSPEHAASLLASTMNWTDARRRDMQRWALDVAWMNYAAPQALTSLFPVG